MFSSYTYLVHSHPINLVASIFKQLSQAEVDSTSWEDLKDYAIECGLSAESVALLDYKLSTMSYEEIIDRTYGLYSDIDEVKEVMKSDIEEKVKPIARKKRGGTSTGGKYNIMCTSYVTFSRLLFTNLNFTNPPQ